MHEPSSSPACIIKRTGACLVRKYSVERTWARTVKNNWQSLKTRKTLFQLTGLHGSTLCFRIPRACVYPAGGGGLQFLGGYNLGRASHVLRTLSASRPEI
jgi:hypothetical protein